MGLLLPDAPHLIQFECLLSGSTLNKLIDVHLRCTTNGFETIQDISTYCEQSRNFFIFKGQFTEEKKQQLSFNPLSPLLRQGSQGGWIIVLEQHRS